MTVEYRKGDSLLHRLDARTKLLLFVGLTVLAVIIEEPVVIALMFTGLYLFGLRAVDNEVLNKNLRVLVVIFLTFAAFQILFFTPSDAVPLFYLIPGRQWVPITVQGLVRGVAVFFRFFIVVLAVHLMLYTTPPVDLVLALTGREKSHGVLKDAAVSLILGALIFAVVQLAMAERIQALPLAALPRTLVLAAAAALLGYLIHRAASHGLPPEMGVALSLGFATVGILSQQTQKIMDAQKARGYDVKPKNLVRRVQVLTALLLPIFLATLQRSQDIAVAILARAFDYNIAERTYRRQLVFHPRDYAVMGVIILFLLGGLVMNYLGYGNLTEKLILQSLGW